MTMMFAKSVNIDRLVRSEVLEAWLWRWWVPPKRQEIILRYGYNPEDNIIHSWHFLKWEGSSELSSLSSEKRDSDD